MTAVLNACAPVESPPPDQPLPPGVEAISLLGDTLRRPTQSDTTRARLELDLQRADSVLAATRTNASATPAEIHDAYIWVGRRQAYLGRYRDAIATFTAGIASRDGQNNPRLFRHRGHRHITTRAFDLAIADFERAAALIEGQADEVEPDGAPNALGIPTSTLQFNIWYHLGLARYLRGDWLGALDAYARCREVSTNPDAIAAISYWQYLTHRRAGDDAAAAAILASVDPRARIIENQAYHRLLLHFRGELSRDSVVAPGSDAIRDVTSAYGLAAYDAFSGSADARTALERIVRGSTAWAAFGYIAAEADLARGQ